jgi:flagellar hook-basal body complex protein FliE
MSNLSIENLSGRAEIGQGFGASAASEARVTREMEAQGLPAPQVDKSTNLSSPTFGRMLEQSLEEVNRNQVEANTAIKELAAGRSKNIHETMLTLERADSSLKLMMQVRNKILDAYREIMRMQV